MRPPFFKGQSYNLTGLNLDTSDTVSFGDYFLPSEALAGQKVFQLNAQGNWVEAAPTATANPGQSYWISSRTGTDYAGPLDYSLEYSGGFLFAGEICEAAITLTNRTSAPMVVTIENEDSLPLVSESYDAALGAIWPALGTATLAIPAGEVRNVNIGIRKALLTGQTEGNVLIRGGGAQHRIPVVIGDEIAPTVSLLRTGNAKSAGSAAKEQKGTAKSDGDDCPYAGLWVGQVLVDQVSFVNDGLVPTTPVPTSDSFPLRILLHFTHSGQVTLLGQVTVLKTGVTNNEQFVLISDDSLIDRYGGATIEDGDDFGYRITALGFDTVGGAGIALTGNLEDINVGLSGTILIPKSDPVNPYKHTFSPGSQWSGPVLPTSVSHLPFEPGGLGHLSSNQDFLGFSNH